jgi:EAL domain-containing protein (putative c-di-GMP-specific phosphodiesterase class I)
VFEHYRLMPELDRWVVRKVLELIARGVRIPRFAINLSTQTLQDPAFPKAVALELVSAGVPGTALQFESSENDTLAHLDRRCASRPRSAPWTAAPSFPASAGARRPSCR